MTVGVRPLPLAVIVALTAACGTSTPAARHPSAAPTTSSPPPAASTAPAVLLVGGSLVAATGIPDVAAALAAAGVTVPDGRLLSAVTHRVLDPHLTPGHVLVNGEPAQLTTPVVAGDAISVVAGTDRVEATRAEQVAVNLQPAAVALYTVVTPGSGTATVGAVSGERVSLDILRAPTVGRLRTAARVALSFDDGPNGTFTQQVLNLLVAAHAPAVFCLIGRYVPAQPTLVRAELAAGARLCDHTQNHPLDLPRLTPARIAAEIRDGYASIVAADGRVAPVYFRAPGGNWSARIESDARAAHLVPLRWTVDPKDWSEPGTQTIITRVLDQLRPDGIVLLHDGSGDRSQTVAAFARLLSELHDAGWTFSLPTWVR